MGKKTRVHMTIEQDSPNSYGSAGVRWLYAFTGLERNSSPKYGMFEHFKRYPWVLPVFEYENEDQVIASLDSHVIGPAEARAKEQAGR